MMEDKKLKVEFAPGAFDSFEGTQEELDEFIAEIYKAIDSGELFENSVELTEEEFLELPEEIQQQLVGSLDVESVEVPKRMLQ
jgi:hypothetical protein